MDRIKELISKMTLEEKASLCSGADNWHTKEIKRLNIPSVMMVDGPHGLRKQEGETDHLGLNESVKAVCFPAACATASSFDVDLMERMGETLGAECQAENVSILLGPAVNIKRSPLCGRNFEYLSEDPYLAGRMASAYIRGVQSQGVGTSIKHFALNNQETLRMTISSEVSERALREIYLPAFEEAVKESAPRTVMCSYNKINGEYASENRYLLTDILRKEWGYKGCVVSDWGAVNNRVKGLQAGLDLEMPYSGGYNDRQIVKAVQEGRLDEAVLDEAIALGYNLVISHHPLIFKGYKSITGKDYVERCILKAIKNDIVIYSAHTNLDNAPEGVNFKIAEKIGLKNVRVLEAKENALLKLVTFVPATRAEEVRTALASAGCGCIGNYDSCSYNVEGEGMFRALESANPYCGKIGELHVEKETRIETILPTYRKAEVIKALLAAHPYEEPAFDLYPLQNSWQQAGAGVIGELETPETELEFLKRIKKTFEVGCLKHNRLTGREIQTVALCGGAGAFLMPLAIRNRADVFITGEIKYHDYFGHDTDILLAEIGHYESEQYTKEIFYTIIRDLFPNVEVQQSKINTNPIKYM